MCPIKLRERDYWFGVTFLFYNGYNEIPSAPSKHHKVSAFRRTIQCFLSNIGKTVLIGKRKTCVLELRHFKEKNKILFLFQYLEIHFPISQSPNHKIIRIFRVIIRIIIFGTRASRSVKGRCITKVC